MPRPPRNRYFPRPLLLLLACLLPLGYSCAQAPPPAKKVVVGLVYPIAALGDVVTGFKEGMAEVGYREGENVSYLATDPKSKMEELEGEIKKLVEAKVDLLYVLTTPATLKVKKVLSERQSTIPVVFGPVSSPVESGIVESLRKPGGRMTGVKVGGFVPKQIEWLKKIAPTVRRVYAPYDPRDKAAQGNLKELREVAPEFGLEILTQEVETDEATRQAARELPAGTEAIICLPCGLVTNNIAAFVESGISHQIPTVSMSYDRAKDGILIGYGFINHEVGKQAARIAGQVLRGIPPAELPVETAKYLLALNQATAKAIALEIPEAILRQADNIIR